MNICSTDKCMYDCECVYGYRAKKRYSSNSGTGFGVQHSTARVPCVPCVCPVWGCLCPVCLCVVVYSVALCGRSCCGCQFAFSDVFVFCVGGGLVCGWVGGGGYVGLCRGV